MEKHSDRAGPHYFGDEKQLFAAAQTMPEARAEGMVEALHGGTEGIGERLTARNSVCKGIRRRAQLMANVRSAVAGEHGIELMREVLAGAFVEDEPTVAPARLRDLSLAMVHPLWVALLRHVTGVLSVAEIPFEDLVADVAPAVPLHLGEVRTKVPLPSAGGRGQLPC